MGLLRYDAGELSPSWGRTPSGGILAPAAVTRVGVFPYRKPDGTVTRELRPPEEVFHPEALASLVNAPVTIGHPSGMVTPETYRSVAAGHVVAPARIDVDHVVVDLALQSADVVSGVEAGTLAETSCGYSLEIDPTPGIWNGEAYDSVQRNIRYNHVAMGPRGWGRGGPTVALRMDDAAQVVQDVTDDTPPPPVRVDGGRKPMKIQIPTLVALSGAIRIDGKDFPTKTAAERSAALAALVEAHAALRADSVDPAEALAALNDALSAVQSAQTMLVGLAGTLAEAVAMDPPDSPAEAAAEGEPVPPAQPAQAMDTASIDRLVEERIAVLERARKLHPSIAMDGKSNDEIRAEVLRHVVPSFRADASAEEIRGAFAVLPLPGAAAPHPSMAIVPPARSDAADKLDPAAAAAAALEESRNAWRKPLGRTH